MRGSCPAVGDHTTTGREPVARCSWTSALGQPLPGARPLVSGSLNPFSPPLPELAQLLPRLPTHPAWAREITDWRLIR